jgi:hypothetical protein
MDELLRLLKDTQVGCHLGHPFVGALSYADDLILMPPSLNASQIMCVNLFSNAYDVKFNASKSLSLVFNSKIKSFHLHTYHDEIPRVFNAVH